MLPGSQFSGYSKYKTEEAGVAKVAENEVVKDKEPKTEGETISKSVLLPGIDGYFQRGVFDYLTTYSPASENEEGSKAAS